MLISLETGVASHVVSLDSRLARHAESWVARHADLSGDPGGQTCGSLWTAGWPDMGICTTNPAIFIAPNPVSCDTDAHPEFFSRGEREGLTLRLYIIYVSF
jgi:hypothetical protein